MKKFVLIVCLSLFTVFCFSQDGNTAPPKLPWATGKLLGATNADTTAQTRTDVYITPSNIPSIMAAPGTIGEFKLDHNTETLNAHRTILITDKPIHFFDCNGSDRNVILPAEATNSTDLVFTFVNDSDGAGEDLVIRDDTPTTLITIGPGQGAEVSCDGTSWKVLSDRGIYYDGVSDFLGVGTANPATKLDVRGTIRITNDGTEFIDISHAGVVGSIRSSYSTGSYTPLAFEAGGSERVRINVNGNIGIGTSSPDTLLELQAESADAEETISVYHDTEATAPLITLRKADNNATAPALVDDNAVLGRVNFEGHDGSGWHTGAYIEGRIDGTPSDETDMPTELAFATTPDGSGSPTERLIIQPDGGIDVINRFSVGVMTFTFTTEADITDPLTGSVVLLDGDDDGENDTIDLQDGTTTGQVLYLIAAVEIDADDTCTISYGDTTCTNCPATVFNKVGENAHLIWTGSTWVVISLMDAL